jgi:hypothetical protein
MQRTLTASFYRALAALVLLTLPVYFVARTALMLGGR